jgi:RecA-family ATPase
MTAKISKLDHALALAADGYRIFPLIPNGKQPLLSGSWRILATRNKEQIRKWWTDFPEANIGRVADGEIILDEDRKKDGHKSFEMLAELHHFPETRTVRTPSGGRHLCYLTPPGARVSNGTDVLGPGIDIRTDGGYVVAPGSTINDVPYAYEDERPSVVAPDHVVAGCKTAREKDKDAGVRVADEDESTVDRIEAFIARQKPESVEHGNRDDTAYKVAARFGDYGATTDTILHYLTVWSELCCVPPMAEADLVRVSNSAGGRNRQTAIGSKHPERLAAGFEAVDIAPMTPELAAQHARMAATVDWLEEDAIEAAKDYFDDAPKSPALVWLDMSNWDRTPIPERRWAILNRVPLKQAGLFSGEGGTGKSIIELMKNVAHVLGQSWLDGVPIPVHGPAFYLGAEDDADELHIRLAAIAKHFGISFSDLIKGGLYAASLLGQDATLCYLSGKSGRVETTKLYAELYERAGDLKPVNISIDTLSRAFAGNEIDRVQVYAFAQHMQALAMVAESSVTILSHPSLSGQNSGSGLSGSTAWHGAFRFRQYLRAPTKDEAAEVDQPYSDLRLLEFTKNQYGPIGQSITLHYADGLFLPVKEPTEFEQAARAEEVDATFLKFLERFTREGP